MAAARAAEVVAKAAADKAHKDEEEGTPKIKEEKQKKIKKARRGEVRGGGLCWEHGKGGQVAEGKGRRRGYAAVGVGVGEGGTHLGPLPGDVVVARQHASRAEQRDPRP